MRKTTFLKCLSTFISQASGILRETISALFKVQDNILGKKMDREAIRDKLNT
jgi:hypothetical protein